MDKQDFPGEGRPVVVDVERTHEDADVNFWTGQILTTDIIDAGRRPFFDRDDLLTGSDFPGVHHAAVGRAEKPASGRG